MRDVPTRTEPSSIRLIEASEERERLRFRCSQSLARLRHRLSQAMVRSTIQRLGNTSKPRAPSERLTISRLMC